LTGADFNMFLKLLTTQMQNQDPLDPMDTSQYTQQLVQFSQVEQSMQQTSVLRNILDRLTAADMAQASGFIGREAQFDTNMAGLSDDPAQWSYSLPREPATLTVTVKDSSGRIMASQVLDAAAEGRFSWDGTLPNEGAAAHGTYMLSIEALDANGNAVPAAIRSVGVVDSVTSAAGNVMLSINGTELPSSMLVSVTSPR
jgi:flagellar basal-body rod modification protein FlgD